MTDLDELRRRTVRAETAYLAAKQAYLYAVEAQESPHRLTAAAAHVVASALAQHDADWELHETLVAGKADREDVQEAERSVGSASDRLELWEEILAAHEGRLAHPEPAWRPLTAREREILDFLLSCEFEGVEELRAQAHVARARRYDRDAPTIELKVDPLAAPPIDLPSEPVAAETETATTLLAQGRPHHELMLFAARGYIYQLYIGGQYELDEFPPPDQFNPPRPYPDAEWEDGEDELDA